ncbi:MAG TPA: NAD(P)H-binding protein, partial [bacterium]|nr:NAD(P)H-binding protein [bacterium]
MKVLVIGATGATGSIAVRRLLEAGHQVTAFARDQAKVALTHERLRVAVGDARDAASLDAAVAGQDAVL